MTVTSPSTGPSTSVRVLPAFDATWRSWSGIHGGFLMSVAAAAALGDRTEHTPRSLHASFLASAPDGTALDVSVHPLHHGRSVTTSRASVADGGSTYLELTVMAGSDRPAAHHAPRSAPEVAPHDDCEEFAFPVELVPFSQHLEVRPANDERPLGGGANPELVAWVRFRQPELRPWQQVIVLLDALPPALYAVATLPAPIPSVAMAAFLTPEAAEAAEDWKLVRIRTESAGGGWAIETSTVWATDGQLLGTATQTRRVLGPLT